MPVILPEHNTRDGLDTVNKLAKTLCRRVREFAPIIRQKYGSNQQLMLALTAAETMCEMLIPASDYILAEKYQSSADGRPADPTDIPGTV